MLGSSRTVTTPLTLQVSASTGDATIDAELRYAPSDPLAVTLVIGTQCDEPVIWVFARELLAAGVTSQAGEGDIAIEPADREVRITLATDCLATMLAPRERVMDFLVESFSCVPSGTEFDGIDIDSEIAALLA